MVKFFFQQVLLLTVSFVFLSAQNRANEAVELNKNGNHKEAAVIYEKLLQSDGPSADLYFNLGTVYLLDNRIADARIALENAYRLDPGNKQVNKQLDILKKRIEPQIEALPAILPYQGFIFLRNLTTTEGWGYLLLLLVYLTAVILVIKPKWKNMRWAVYGLISMVLFLSLFYISSRKLQEEKFYVLMNDLPLRIAPDSSSQVLIPLGQGIKTEVNDSLGNWYKVKLENNDQGWLPKANLKNL